MLLWGNVGSLIVFNLSLICGCKFIQLYNDNNEDVCRCCLERHFVSFCNKIIVYILFIY